MIENNPQQQTLIYDYAQVFIRRRSIFFAFLIVCVVTVTLATFLMTPLYQAGTKIIVEGENTNISSADESSTAGSNFDIFENYLETQMAIIKSNSVAGKVFGEFKLGNTPRYKIREGLAKVFQKKFVEDIYLKRLPGTRMIQISVENPDPNIAADVANRMAEVYSSENLKRRALSVIRNQRMASLNTEFLRLQAKLDAMSNVYGPKHPDMIALREEIRAMAKRLENERFAGQNAAAGGSLSEDQALLENTLLNIQESSVLSSSKINNIGIVDRASPPTKIAKPKRVLNIVLGFMLGIFGGLLLAFFVDYIDDTVKTEDDPRRLVGDAIYLGSLLSMENSKKFDTDQLVLNHKDSSAAEAYRLLRTRVLWSISKDQAIKDIAVLSSMPGEGKSTVASNLAIAFAQLDQKVLLVDSDTRRGRLHESYGVPDDRGLAHYLTEKLALNDILKKTSIANLSLVTRGRSVIDSSHLFSSSVMDKFIQETRSRFDTIIYDTPPLTVISDASILIPRLGGVILTLRTGVTSQRVMHRGFATIKESGAHLIGAVLNDSSSRDDKKYSHYYHAYEKT